MSRNEWQEVTDNPYSAKVLLYILKNNKIKRSELNKFANGQTMIKTIEFLESLGLIKITTVEIPRKIGYLTLTEKGERTAKRFDQILKDEPLEEENYKTPEKIHVKEQTS